MNLKQWLDYQLSIHPTEIDLGLSRVYALAESLGLKDFPGKIITVAGTNGKGSTVAFLEQILRGMGLRTGTYTSPHFVNYTERITLSGQAITEDELCEHFAAIEAARQEHSLTFFEYGTLAAVRACAQHKVDVMILEIGLGGRLDACNAWDADVAIVTSIGVDHVDWLGDDIELIGIEKAGVFRANCPAIVGQDVPQSVLDYVHELSAELYQLGTNFNYTLRQSGWDWSSAQQKLTNLTPPALQGQFQYSNASLAIKAVACLWADKVTSEVVSEAMAEVKLTGRLQVTQYRQVEFLLDVAHNPHAAQTLANFLQANKQKTVAVFAMMKDKDIKETVRLLLPFIGSWFVFDLKTERAASQYELHKILSHFGVRVKTCDNCQQALDSALEQADSSTRVLVFGSFFTVAEFLERQHNDE